MWICFTVAFPVKHCRHFLVLYQNCTAQVSCHLLQDAKRFAGIVIIAVSIAVTVVVRFQVLQQSQLLVQRLRRRGCRWCRSLSVHVNFGTYNFSTWVFCAVNFSTLNVNFGTWHVRYIDRSSSVHVNLGTFSYDDAKSP